MNTQTTIAYSQEASQSERKRILKQDIDALRRAISPEVGPAVPVILPRLPASSPWAQPGPGLEPPLMRDINALNERRRS